MKISVIVAIDGKKAIGCKKTNSMPWKRIPIDMKRFAALTKKSGVVIMGRLTHQSIGKPLPERKNIVLTRKKNFKSDGIYIASSFKNALSLAEKFKPKPKEIMVIGGRSIYREAFSSFLVETIYLTKIQEEFKGDIFLPEIPGLWKKTGFKFHPKGDNTPYSLTFERYERVN